MYNLFRRKPTMKCNIYNCFIHKIYFDNYIKKLY